MSSPPTTTTTTTSTSTPTIKPEDPLNITIDTLNNTPQTTTSTNDNNEKDTMTNNNPESPVTSLLQTIQSAIKTLLPPHLLKNLSTTASAHPHIATFLACQFAFSCIPAGMFLAGAMIAASVGVVMFTCFAGMVLGPVFVVTTVVGGFVWAWGWVVWVFGGWVLGMVVGEERGEGVEEEGELGKVNGYQNGYHNGYGNGHQNGEKDGGCEGGK